MTGFGCIACSKLMFSVRPDLLVNRRTRRGETGRIDVERKSSAALWRLVVSALAQTPRLD